MNENASLWRQKYIAPDGGGKLETYDEREPFIEGAPRITKNENSQLFLVLGHIALNRLQLLTTEDKETFIRHTNSAEIQPGLYARRQGDLGIRQSHDNLLAIVTGSVIHETDHAKKICSYGESNGWCFSLSEEWELESCLQGGDIALIKIAAGKTPTLWECLWFLGGMLTKKDAGQINLLSVRMYALWCYKRRKNLLTDLFVILADLIFQFRFEQKMVSSVQEYFKRDDERNPFIDLWEEAWT